MANAAGRLDRSDDSAEAHQGMLRAENLLQLPGCLHAILQRKHPGQRPEEWAHCSCRFGDLPGLNRKNDGVDLADIFGVITGLRHCNCEIALRASHPQSALADSLKLRPAGYHRN